jgi:cytosine deaminase
MDARYPPAACHSVRIPRAALCAIGGWRFDRDGFALADLTIDADGRWRSIVPAATTRPGEWIALPPLVEPHTHIDKAFLRARAPNPENHFEGARRAIARDRAGGWSYEDALARMERALELAWRHGVRLLRTHIDSQPERLEPCWEVYAELRRRWRGRISLQAVASLGGGKLAGAHGERLARLCRQHDALLGPVLYADADLRANIARMFELAERFELHIDAHVDENNYGHADGLRAILDHLARQPFAGRITLSHLCSLSRCESQEIDLLARRAGAAGLTVIALPVANLHLQDRDRGDTPYWRGLTAINALARADVDVALGGDNSQDMFVPWGALDPLAVLRDGMLAAHLDEPLGEAVGRVAATAARILGEVDIGQWRLGEPADLTLLRAADPFAALSGDFEERLTVRGGKVVARLGWETG